MEKQKRGKPSGAGVLTAAVLAFLAAVMILNLRAFFVPLTALAKGESSFPQFVQQTQAAFTSSTMERTAFVNINGLFSRALGQRVCNGVIRLDNGMLTFPSYEKDMGPTADNLIEFNEFLADRDIPLLYVQAPCKVDLEGELMPDGMEYPANGNADELLRRLEQSGVHTCDLRPALSATAEAVTENFFATDHHWTCTAALKAFPIIVERLSQLTPGRDIDMTYTDPDLWEAHTYRDWFLGSQGKRVGAFFGGVDDITYYTPKFETKMSCAVPMIHYAFYHGDFSDAVLRMNHIEKRDLFKLSPYCVYIGGDYPVVQHRNADAPNKLKVVMIKDSFTLPMQAYFSTIFQEVHVLDPRYMTSCNVSEYITMCQPDLVMVMISADMLGPAGYTDFGSAATAAWEDALGEPRVVVEEDAIELPASESQYNFAVVADDLAYGKRYTLRFDGVERLEGDPASVGALLYNASTSSAIDYGVIDLEYGVEHGCSWSFFTPDEGGDQLQLLLYSGMPGETAGIHLRYSGVTLTEEG